MPVTDIEHSIIAHGDALSRLAQSPDGQILKDILLAIQAEAFDKMLVEKDPLQIMRHRAVCGFTDEFLHYWSVEIDRAREVRDNIVRRGDDPQ